MIQRLKDGSHFEDLGLNGRIILKWTLQEKCEVVWTALKQRSRRSSCAIFCEYSEPLGYRPDELLSTVQRRPRIIVLL